MRANCQVYPVGTQVVSGSDDSTLKLWDVTSGECLQTLRGMRREWNAYRFLLDGMKLASGSKDYNIKIWQNSGRGAP